MVRGHDHHRPTVELWTCTTGDADDVHRESLEASEATGWLGQVVEALARDGLGGGVQRSNAGDDGSQGLGCYVCCIVCDCPGGFVHATFMLPSGPRGMMKSTPGLHSR